MSNIFRMSDSIKHLNYMCQLFFIYSWKVWVRKNELNLLKILLGFTKLKKNSLLTQIPNFILQNTRIIIYYSIRLKPQGTVYKNQPRARPFSRSKGCRSQPMLTFDYTAFV